MIHLKPFALHRQMMVMWLVFAHTHAYANTHTHTHTRTHTRIRTRIRTHTCTRAHALTQFFCPFFSLPLERASSASLSACLVRNSIRSVLTCSVTSKEEPARGREEETGRWKDTQTQKSDTHVINHVCCACTHSTLPYFNTWQPLA